MSKEKKARKVAVRRKQVVIVMDIDEGEIHGNYADEFQSVTDAERWIRDAGDDGKVYVVARLFPAVKVKSVVKTKNVVEVVQ